MTVSKAWDWKDEKNQIWFNPSEECYFLSARWKKQGYAKLLDLGCGLGRHSIFFSQQGFNVSAFDLSKDGADHLKKWAEKENLKIDIQIADMLSLPYPDDTFDCLFAYHVIFHTDTIGMLKIIREIKRVTKPQGEIYVTLGSKESLSFRQADYPKIDENTILKTDDGPEKDIPHFYVNLDDIIRIFNDENIELISIRHTDDCYSGGVTRNSNHYFILAKNKE